jgi:hypothetical protein
VALSLRNRGYRAWALLGGYRAWQEAGFPIEAKADEMERQLEGSCPECGLPWSDHAAVT